jgi:hypothetical protein
VADATGWFALGGAAIGVTPVAIKAVFDWFAAKAERDNQQAVKLRDEHRKLISDWRSGLAASHAMHQRWLVAKYKNVPSRTIIVPPDKPIGASDEPDAVGSAWFASLRPHISEIGQGAVYRNPLVLYCNNATVIVLQDEIARIEKEWLG